MNFGVFELKLFNMDSGFSSRIEDKFTKKKDFFTTNLQELRSLLLLKKKCLEITSQNILKLH